MAVLLANVLANPADDDRLLVYADALADAGDPERGELVVLGCRLASSPWYANEHPAEEARRQELVEHHQQRWVAPLTKLGVGDVRFHRGLIDTITIPAAAFMKHGAELFEREPIRRVNLVRIEEVRNRDLTMLGETDLVGRLEALGLPGAFLNRGRIEALFSGRSAARTVPALDLSNTVWDRDVLSNITRVVAPFTTTDVVLTNVRARGRVDEPIAPELLSLFPRIERLTAKRLPGLVMTRLIGDVVKARLRGLDLAVEATSTRRRVSARPSSASSLPSVSAGSRPSTSSFAPLVTRSGSRRSRPSSSGIAGAGRRTNRPSVRSWKRSIERTTSRSLFSAVCGWSRCSSASPTIRACDRSVRLPSRTAASSRPPSTHSSDAPSSRRSGTFRFAV
jgi:uncharacterized protein (TIGR02996 family)